MDINELRDKGLDVVEKAKDNDVLYNATLGFFFKNLAKRSYIRTNAIIERQRDLDNGKETEDLKLSTLLMYRLNSYFIFDILLFILFSSKLSVAFLLIIVLYLINNWLYFNAEFTDKKYLDIYRNMLIEKNESYKFKENKIYHNTPLFLSQFAVDLEKFLEDSSSKSRNAKFKDALFLSSSFDVIDTNKMNEGSFKDFIERVEATTGRGSVLVLKIDDKFKNNVTISIDDEYVRLMRVIPQFQKNRAVYSENGIMLFDGSCIVSNNEDDEVDEYYDLLENMYTPYFKEYRDLMKEREKLEEERAERLAKEREKVELKELYNSLVNEKGMSEKGAKILIRLKRNQGEFGFSVHDMFGRSMTFSDDYLKIRANLMGNTTLANVNSKKQLIAQKCGVMPKISVAENESSIYLLFMLKDRIKSKKLSYKQIEEDAEKGIVNIGAGALGDVKVLYPREDEPFFSLIGGISRSGKSTFATRFITGALLLKDNNNFYDYQDVFIMSMKATDDYIPLKWNRKGMYMTDEPLKMYKMLQTIDEIAQKRVDIFREANVVNIKDYNKKYPENKMGKILLVVDEYKNTLTSAESMKIETDGGKKKLSEAIEELLVKINSLHGSRGVNTIVITQSFAKNSVGRVRDTLGSHFLGYADKDVWNSIDASQEMSNYMKSKEGKRQGLFFMKTPDFALVDGVEVDKFDSGFVEISTHFTATEDIARNFNRIFDTKNKYKNVIENGLNNADIRDNIKTTTRKKVDINNYDDLI